MWCKGVLFHGWKGKWLESLNRAFVGGSWAREHATTSDFGEQGGQPCCYLQRYRNHRLGRYTYICVYLLECAVVE